MLTECSELALTMSPSSPEAIHICRFLYESESKCLQTEGCCLVNSRCEQSLYELEILFVPQWHCTPIHCPVTGTVLIKWQPCCHSFRSSHIQLFQRCVRASNHSESSPLMTLQAGRWSPWQPAVAREERWLEGKSNVGQHKRGIFLKNLSDLSLELIHHFPGCCSWLQAGSWLKRAHERKVRPASQPRWQSAVGEKKEKKKEKENSLCKEFSKCYWLLFLIYGT